MDFDSYQQEIQKIISDNLNSKNDEELSFIFKDKQPYLAQMAWVEAINYFIEVFDISIKSLTGSIEYTKEDISDKVTSQKTQLKRLTLLLQDYLDFLNTIVWLKNYELSDGVEGNKIYHSYAHLDSYTKALQKYLNELISKIDDPQLNGSRMNNLFKPTRSFNVSAWIIGGLQTTIGTERVQILGTGEDIFTTIHQNLLHTLNKIYTNILSKNPLQLSPPIQSFEKEVEKVREKWKNSKVHFGGVGTIQLNSIYMQGKTTYLKYNVPLHNHSSQIDVQYGLGDKYVYMTIRFYGQSTNNRWRVLQDTFIESSTKSNLIINKQTLYWNGFEATWSLPVSNDQSFEAPFNVLTDCIWIANSL